MAVDETCETLLLRDKSSRRFLNEPDAVGFEHACV